jgi:tRNA(fMet)-specific endonuclease VapC
VDKVLIDTSTFFDIRRAAKNPKATWAQYTIHRLLQYQAHHPKLTVSAFTGFEHLDGLHRQGKKAQANEFRAKVLPSLEVIYPDEATYALAAEIHAALPGTGKTIGLADTFIAATAITQKLALVNANTKHFSRIHVAGFPIILQNWRDP